MVPASRWATDEPAAAAAPGTLRVGLKSGTREGDQHVMAATRTKSSTGSWRRALLWATALTLAGRLLALALGLLLWETDQVPEGPDYADPHPLDAEPVMGPVSGWTSGVWQRHDTLLYLEIAGHGYDRREATIVFPPLYPLAIRAVGVLTLGNLLAAALLVSTAATIVALAVLYRLTEDLFDADVARWATVYQLVFPTGYILLAAYAEPMMLLFTVLTFYLAVRGRLGWAGVAAFAAALTRAQAAVLFVPLAVTAWRLYGRGWWRRGDAIWATAAGPLAVAAYQVYLTASGLPRMDEVYRDVWRSVPTVPGYELWLSVREVAGPTTIGRRLALLVFVAAVALTVLAFRRLPVEYGLYMAAVIGLVLLRHDELGRPLLSFSRHALMLFPGFVALAATVRKRTGRLALAYASGAVNMLLLSVFFLWGFSE